jgi:hypothetical protein
MVSGSAAHQIEQFWHFAPSVLVEVAANKLTAHILGEHFSIQARFKGDGLTLELVRGADNPPLGWYSGAYELKEPCSTIRISCTAAVTTIEAQFDICLRN